MLTSCSFCSPRFFDCFVSLISRDGESRLALAACRAEAQTQTHKAPSVRQIALGAVPETLVAVELAAPGHARNGRPLAQSRCFSLLSHAIQGRNALDGRKTITCELRASRPEGKSPTGPLR